MKYRPGHPIHDIIRDVAELPDRTSPEGQQDMMLVTAAELEAILDARLYAPIRMMEENGKCATATNHKR